jgi:hypothetical protein
MEKDWGKERKTARELRKKGKERKISVKGKGEK